MLGASRERIPDGAPGLRVKVRRIRELVEASKRDPNFRALVARHVSDLAPRDNSAEIERVVSLVRGRMRYIRDPYGVETFTDPRLLWSQMERGDGAIGDCDDHVLAASAALEVLGYPTRYRVGGEGPGRYRHIWLEVAPNRFDGWLPIELTRPLPIGYDPSERFAHVESHLGAFGERAPRDSTSRHGVPMDPFQDRVSALAPFTFGGPVYRGFTPGDILRMTNAMGISGAAIKVQHRTHMQRAAAQRAAARSGAGARRVAVNPAFRPVEVRGHARGLALRNRTVAPRELPEHFDLSLRRDLGRRAARLSRRGLGGYPSAADLSDWYPLPDDELGGFGKSLKKAFKKATKKIGKVTGKVLPKPLKKALKPVQKLVGKIPGASLPILPLPIAPLAQLAKAAPLPGVVSATLPGMAAVNAPVGIAAGYIAPKPLDAFKRDAPIAGAIAVGVPLILGGGAGLLTGATGITGALIETYGAGGGGGADEVVDPGPVYTTEEQPSFGGGSWLPWVLGGLAVAGAVAAFTGGGRLARR